MKQLQILAVTMRQSDFSLVERMRLQCDAVIANQTDCFCSETREMPFGRVTMISTDTVGVGVNRNIALTYADAELVLFADDDVTYADGVPERVIAAFRDRPEADVLIFGMDLTKQGEVFRRIRPPAKRLHLWNSMRYGTYVIAARRAQLERCGIRFHTQFGGGCLYGAGEDSIFLKSCFDHGLRVYGSEIVLGACAKDVSSWFRGCNEKYFYDKGALMGVLFPRLRHVMAAYFSLRFKRETELGAAERLRWMLRGVRGGRSLLAYPGNPEKRENREL